MNETPTTWTRLVSLVKGEVSANTLEAYRRASLSVLELLDQAEAERNAAAADGLNAWTMPTAKQAELACTWNAFVLQTLGNAFLDADYQDDPATVGFVPAITADQVLRFYAPVEEWLTRAQQAHADAHYNLDIPLPAELPAWSEVEPCPNSHLHGMLNAMKAIRDHAQAAMTVLEAARDLSEAREAERGTLRGIYAAACSKARYADDMHRQNPSREVHERIEEHLKVAISQFYRLGQLAAVPALVTRVQPIASVTVTPRRLPAPGETGFDPWCLTDPEARRTCARDPKARLALDTQWELDSAPAKTLTIQSEITEAYTRGDIQYAKKKSGEPLGYFFCTPWGSIYTVVRPVTLGGVRLSLLQQFVFDVTAEGFHRGVPFRRHIKVGNFQPTNQFEYGDPYEAPDH